MDKIRTKVQNADWWELGYLVIYGVIFAYEFLNTTMFEIQWPPRVGYVFLAGSALYTIAKFIWHNTYTKKEMIWAGTILFAFIMPALLTEYRFLWWTGFLIVGAKDVDFRKVLKVYLVISSTIMVIAFAASQYGIIEDLQYILYRNGIDHIRHSYGIVYPTDFAAHLFYMVLAVVICFQEKLGLGSRIWICCLVAGCVYLVSNAQTTTLCLIGFSVLCILERMLRKYMKYCEKILKWIPMICATFFLGTAYEFNPQTPWMVKLDNLLSNRLSISHEAFCKYDVKLFGQFIVEVGNGRATEHRNDYFFLDDVYIRILLEYGLVLFVVTFLVLAVLSKRASDRKQFIIVIAIVGTAVHSIMEHHLLEVAYNPLIFALFAFLNNEEQIDRRKRCIEERVKVG